eukprot:gb/GECG01008037.1/.p1 GENE.gb/GECG01008037.1/~~gb/GECG01008037.1/.p1  ORF type:complete len:201 (+),score=15.09 gb/GECG01008037.1/:1-603(+)
MCCTCSAGLVVRRRSYKREGFLETLATTVRSCGGSGGRSRCRCRIIGGRHDVNFSGLVSYSILTIVLGGILYCMKRETGNLDNSSNPNKMSSTKEGDQQQHQQVRTETGKQQESLLHSAANLGERIWDSIITPGTAPGLPLVINIATVGMLLCLVFTILIGYGNIHVYALGGLGIGLLASVNWYVLSLECPPSPFLAMRN